MRNIQYGIQKTQTQEMQFNRANTEEEFKNNLIPKKIYILYSLRYDGYRLNTIDRSTFYARYDKEKKVFWSTSHCKYILEKLNISHTSNKSGRIFIKEKDVDLNGYEL